MQKLNQTANVFSYHFPFSWARISGRLWIIVKLLTLTILKSPFLTLELIQSKDLRSITPQAQGTTCSWRMTGHDSQLHPVIVCNWQLTTSTRHSEFTESGRENNSNCFFICSRLGSFMKHSTRGNWGTSCCLWGNVFQPEAPRCCKGWSLTCRRCTSAFKKLDIYVE